MNYQQRRQNHVPKAAFMQQAKSPLNSRSFQHQAVFGGAPQLQSRQMQTAFLPVAPVKVPNYTEAFSASWTGPSGDPVHLPMQQQRQLTPGPGLEQPSPQPHGPPPIYRPPFAETRQSSIHSTPVQAIVAAGPGSALPSGLASHPSIGSYRPISRLQLPRSTSNMKTESQMGLETTYNNQQRETTPQPLEATNQLGMRYSPIPRVANNINNTPDPNIVVEEFYERPRLQVQIEPELKLFLRMAHSLDLFRFLMKQERYDKVVSQLSAIFAQVSEERRRYQGDLDNAFYAAQFQIFCQSTTTDERSMLHLKAIDANALIEVFEIINDLVVIIISHNYKDVHLQEFLNFLMQVKNGIDQNLNENEFEGISEFESEILKHSLDSRLYQNLSCYYSKYMNDHQASQAYGQRATQAEFEIFQLKKATKNSQVYQMNEDPLQDQANHAELNGLAIGYNNQAVIELKQGNAIEALKMSQSSVMILESPVCQYIQNHPDQTDEYFFQQLQSLLIAYYNLGMSHEQMQATTGPSNQDHLLRAQQIYEQGFELSNQFLSPDDILVKKLKFKLFKLKQNTHKQSNSDFNYSVFHQSNHSNKTDMHLAPSSEHQSIKHQDQKTESGQDEVQEEESLKALLAQQSEQMQQQIALLQKQNVEMHSKYENMMKQQKEELQSKMTEAEARIIKAEQIVSENTTTHNTKEEEKRQQEQMAQMAIEKKQKEEDERQRQEALKREEQLRVEEEARIQRESQEMQRQREQEAREAAEKEEARLAEEQRRAEELTRIEREEARREEERVKAAEIAREAQALEQARLEKLKIQEAILLEQAKAEAEEKRKRELVEQQEREAAQQRKAQEDQQKAKELEAERLRKVEQAKAELEKQVEKEQAEQLRIIEEEARAKKEKFERQQKLRALKKAEEEAEAEAELRLIEEQQRKLELQQRAELQNQAEVYVTEVEASIQAKQLEKMLKVQQEMQDQMRTEMEEQRRQFLEEMDNQKRQHQNQLKQQQQLNEERDEREKARLKQEREAAQRELVHQREDHHSQVQQREREREQVYEQMSYQDQQRREEHGRDYSHQERNQSKQHDVVIIGYQQQAANISEAREPYRARANNNNHQPSLPQEQDNQHNHTPQESLQPDPSGNIEASPRNANQEFMTVYNNNNPQKQIGGVVPKAAPLNNISLPIRDYKEMDVNQMIAEEQSLYDASRAFLNNDSEILKEIDRRKKITVSKIVYSKGMYNKFSITARSHAIAAKEANASDSRAHPGEVPPCYQPVFQLTGSCLEPLKCQQEASIQFHPTTLYFYELDSLMKLLVTKEVLPASTSINHIRCFEDMAKYLLFPFMQLFIPATGNELANLDDSSDASSHHEGVYEVSSQISHNLSNASTPNKTRIELWARAPGLLKHSIVIHFLRDICNIAIYHIEDRNFRISITSLEKENKGLNQLVLDLKVDEQSFEYFFKGLEAKDCKQKNSNNINGPVHPEKSSSDRKAKKDNHEEIFLSSVEIIGTEFFKHLEPCIQAYEEVLIQEFGKEISFDCVVLDKKGIIYQIRMSGASEESEPKLELWTLIDSQRHGYFMIRCQTLYKLRIKKHHEEEVVRTYKCSYSEFNSLFGIKKHELDRSLLIIFCYKYLGLLCLFMPTMKYNRGDEEDSDYEEEVSITRKKWDCLASARRIMRLSNSNGENSEPRLVTIQLMGVDDEQCRDKMANGNKEEMKYFLGIKITLFNQKQLKEEGYFFFVNQKRWALSAAEIEQYGLKKLQKRRSKKEELICHYKLVHFLQDQGFSRIFDGTKHSSSNSNRNQLCWQLQNNGDDSTSQLVKGDVFESYFTPEMVDPVKFKEWAKKQIAK